MSNTNNEQLRVATWNIAGGHPILSSRMFDYAREDIGYFTETLKALNADVVCLQESHTSNSRSLAQELGEFADYPHSFNTPVSPSHIDSRYQLSLVILSKQPIVNAQYTEYPYPFFGLIWPDGTEADRHDKGVQTVEIDGLQIANTHLPPIGMWGYNYEHGLGGIYGRDLEHRLREQLTDPVILCGDLNHRKPWNIFPRLFRELELAEALPIKNTGPLRPGQRIRKPDHILYSKGLTYEDSRIIPTNTDHYLCYADLKRK